MMTTRRAALALGASALLAAPAIAQQAGRVTMRLSHPVPTGHHIHQILAAFAADVGQATNGQVDVQVFPAEQAARAAENHPSVARGGIEAASSTNFQWGNTIPEMNVTVIPFFYTELEKIRRWFDSPAAQLLDQKLAQRGVTNIMWLYTTRQTIFTSNRAHLRNPADFRGVKIRGLNRIADAALTAVGAAPSAMPAPEVYQALQSGVLDAALTDVSAAVSRRFYEVQRFGVVNPYFMVWYHVYVNPAWWNGLAANLRETIRAASRRAELAAFDVTERTAGAATGTLRERGMNIHESTPAEVAAWTAAMRQPVIDEFLRAAPQDGQRIIDAIQRL